MNDEIIAYLREQADGAPPEVIAGRFLKIKNSNRALADVAVSAVLSKDARARKGEDGLWRANAAAGDGSDDISNTPWVSVYALVDTTRKTVVHVSLWTPLPEMACLRSVWLRDPAQLSEDDRERLCDPRDTPFDGTAAAEAVDLIARTLAGMSPIFFSQQQYSLLTLTAYNHGVSHGIDDYYLANQLLRAVKEPEFKPLTLESAAASILGGYRTAESAYRQGELFCAITADIIGRMNAAGIENRGQLDAALGADGYDFAGKSISAKMIEELPARVGVYGFTDKDGVYIYIGKAVNLKRRIESYFRFNSESPDKLRKLRDAAHGLTIHRCGSELEALIYEYRLIKKHKPPLNSHLAISERKGSYKPLPDSVVILPHSQDGFNVSLWIRRDQKIKLRSYETTFAEEEALTKELRDYFYTETLPASPEDFPELEIVTRWLKRHRDDYPLIQVGGMADAASIVEAMKHA